MLAKDKTATTGNNDGKEIIKIKLQYRKENSDLQINTDFISIEIEDHRIKSFQLIEQRDNGKEIEMTTIPVEVIQSRVY